MNKAGPTASPTLLVPNFCTLNKIIRKATAIITTSSAYDTKKKKKKKKEREKEKEMQKLLIWPD